MYPRGYRLYTPAVYPYPFCLSLPQREPATPLLKLSADKNKQWRGVGGCKHHHLGLQNLHPQSPLMADHQVPISQEDQLKYCLSFSNQNAQNLEELFSSFSRHQNHLHGLVEADIWAIPPGFCIWQFWVENQISYNFPDCMSAAGLATRFGSPLRLHTRATREL